MSKYILKAWYLENLERFTIWNKWSIIFVSSNYCNFSIEHFWRWLIVVNWCPIPWIYITLGRFSMYYCANCACNVIVIILPVDLVLSSMFVIITKMKYFIPSKKKMKYFIRTLLFFLSKSDLIWMLMLIYYKKNIWSFTAKYRSRV